MKFDDFIKSGQVRKSSKDPSLIKSLNETANSDLRFLNELKISENSSRKIVANYYDVLRSVLEATALEQGYKVYSHEAFTYFLKEKKKEAFAEKFDRMRKIRNKINYYGKTISVAEAESIAKEIKELIPELRKAFLKEKADTISKVTKNNSAFENKSK